ncbi:hypothetical protein, partial [Staphylococcus cohnii]|uniref:hypothetical protein n=1 Tax=Staphylococcus cohnii TaxID=29382 RepID=UPI001A7E0AEB
ILGIDVFYFSKVYSFINDMTKKTNDTYRYIKLFSTTSLIEILHRADARGNDMSERLQARAISPGKHARSKSQVFK